MQPRTSAILLAIALALGAFVYFYEIGGEDARREAEEQARRLFPAVEQDAVEWIALATREGIEARLERREGSWSLAEPVVFPADRFAVDGMAANLAGLVSEAALENPQPLLEYDLDDAARTVRFSAGGQERALLLGRQTPVGSNTYAKTGGSDAVYTVQTYKAQSFDKALDDLREKRILDFDTSAIQRVEARWPNGRVVLERAEAAGDGADGQSERGAWRLVAPLEARADDEVVDDLLSDLSYLRAVGFVDDPPDAAEAGLDPPSFEVILTPAEEGGAEVAPIRLAVGGLHEGERLVRGAHASLYTIAADRFDDFPRELVDYRFKQLSRFDISDARQLDLFFQSTLGDPVAITVTRGDAGWSASPGEQELRGLGLSPPNVILSVFGEVAQQGGDEPGVAPKLAEVHIGGSYGPDGIIARAVGDPVVYRLDYELAEHIPVSLEAFRNRFVDEGGAEIDDPLGEDFLSPTEESP
jgi:hypothetical protein